MIRFILFIVSFYISIPFLKAQNESKVQAHFGLSLDYPINFHTVGFTARSSIDLFQKIRLVPAFTKYLNTFPSNSAGFPTNSTQLVSAWEAEFYTQYLVETSDITIVYFSAGYGYYKSKLISSNIEIPHEEIHRYKVGTGLQVALNRWKIIGDVHFVFGSGFDFVPALGFLYTVTK